MKKSLANVGNSPYHHHFHNPIVGMNEGDFKYNSKWRINNTDLNLSSEIGHVKPGDYRRG